MVKGHPMSPRWLHSTGQSEQQLPLEKGGFLKIPDELQQLNHAPEAIARPIPRFAVDVDLESYEPDPTLTTTANIKDLCWLLTSHNRTPDQSVPAWTGFNQLTITNKQQVTSVGYLPIINASAQGLNVLSSRVETVMYWYL